MAVVAGVAVFSVAWLLLCNFVVYALNENSSFARRWRFSRFFAVTNGLQCSEASDRPRETLAWDVLDHKHLVSSAYGIEIKHILFYRLLVLVCFVLGIVIQALWGITLAPVWMTYFTNWTFVAMAIYSVLGISLCLKKWRGDLGTSWLLHDKLFLLIYVMACTNGIFLTAFYWAILYDGGSVSADNIFRHGLNAILMLGELFVSRVPICTYHLQVCFSYVSVYAIFFWTYFGISGDWHYKALSWENTTAILYYILLPFLGTGAFSLMYLCAHIRERMLSQSVQKLDQAGGGIEMSGMV